MVGPRSMRKQGKYILKPVPIGFKPPATVFRGQFTNTEDGPLCECEGKWSGTLKRLSDPLWRTSMPLIFQIFVMHYIGRFPWKPTFERRLIFGCAFEGFLRFAITFEVPTTVLWGRRKSLPAVWCHWLTVAVIYF